MSKVRPHHNETILQVGDRAELEVDYTYIRRLWTIGEAGYLLIHEERPEGSSAIPAIERYAKVIGGLRKDYEPPSPPGDDSLTGVSHVVLTI